ncbi:MAG: protease modulator HflC [Pseudomonadota bacterium]|nr:protease modulator HflC [Pseudomonadota bacterium]MDE3037600.1 protease modulator HflC [Pseudomonadota bacterium]
MRWIGAGAAAAAAGLLVLANTLFTVDQTEQALVLQFGRPVRIVRTPGIAYKIPFVQNVVFYDNRLLDFDAAPKEVIASDQKRLIVDAFLRWRITDPLRFLQSAGNEYTMRSRLNSILESSLRQALGSVPLSAVISEKRAELMQEIRALVNQQVESSKDNPGGFGIEVADVRIKRADLPPANSEGIFRRMQTEREREAKQFRAQGAEDAQKIRSEADKQRTIILADAKKQSEITRGEGDAAATRIYAKAFDQDPDFFQFYRTLEAYRKAFSPKDTTMILSPNNEFLKDMEKGGAAGH